MARKRKKKTHPRREDVLEVRLRTPLAGAGLTRKFQEMLFQEFSRELRRKMSAADRAELESAISARMATYHSGSLALPVRLKDGRVVLLTANGSDTSITADETPAHSAVSDIAASETVEATVSEAPSVKLPPATRAEFVLSVILNADDRETILGDLSEDYQTYALPRYGEDGARRWYRLQIWRSLLPLVLKRGRALLRWAVLADLVKRGLSRLS